MPSKANSKEFQRRRSGRLATIKRTNENIVVFKVFANYKDKSITEEALLKQFSSFGKIKEVTMIESQNEENTCKVTYYDPMSAAHLLGCSFIRINRSHIMIKPCPYWEQPLQVTSYIENQPSTSTSGFKPAQYTEDILKLNDYCLEMIFDYLDLKSQLRFSSCHDRLENIFINMTCPRLIPKQLLMDELTSGKFSVWEIWQFFKTAGHCIKDIKITKKFDCRFVTVSERDIYNMVEEFCKNVKRVQFMQVLHYNGHILNIFNVNTLTEIELYYCNIMDSDFEILLKCRNVTSLGLAQNIKLLGDFLPSFEQLKRLSLYQCCKIKVDNLRAACIKMNLKYLDIRKTSDDGTSRSEFLKHCTELETLKMAVLCNNDLEQIIHLENIKSLELIDCYKAASSSLATLFEKCDNNLETLKLLGINNILPNTIVRFSSLRVLWIGVICSSIFLNIMQYISSLKELEELYLKKVFMISDMDLKSVLKNCLKLKRLCINECNIKSDFIQSWFEILQERDYNTPTTSAAASLKPLTIYLIDTNIKSSFIKNFNISSTNKLLILKKIAVEPPNGLLSDDLPFDAKEIVYDDEDDDTSDTSDDDSDEIDDVWMDRDEDNIDYNILFYRPLCNPM